jgi:DNA repair protein RadC
MQEHAGVAWNDGEVADLVARVTGAPFAAGEVGRLRRSIGGLRGVLRRPIPEVCASSGLSEAVVRRLRDALSLARIAWRETDERLQVRGAREVFERFALLSAEPREELWVLVLDGANRVLSRERVGGGDDRRVPSTPAEVLAPCVRLGATRVILVHNHPSGVATPSRDDVALYRLLVV